MVKITESIITTFDFTPEEILKQFNIQFDDIQHVESDSTSIEITSAIHHEKVKIE